MNQRIPTVSNPSSETQVMFDAIKGKLGMVPNLFQTLAQSPAVLESYLNFSGALNKTKISAGLREQIALTVAGANGCDYCASAHTAIGKMVKLESPEMTMNLEGKSADAKTQAALTFCRQVVETRGHVKDADVSALRTSGFSDQEIVEIVAVTMQNMFTNYANHIFATAIDFPVVSTAQIKKAA